MQLTCRNHDHFLNTFEYIKAAGCDRNLNMVKCGSFNLSVKLLF